MACKKGFIFLQMVKKDGFNLIFCANRRGFLIGGNYENGVANKKRQRGCLFYFYYGQEILFYPGIPFFFHAGIEEVVAFVVGNGGVHADIVFAAADLLCGFRDAGVGT